MFHILQALGARLMCPSKLQLPVLERDVVALVEMLLEHPPLMEPQTTL